MMIVDGQGSASEACNLEPPTFGVAVLRAFTPPTTNSFVSESALPILGNESRKRSEPLEKRSFSDQSGSARFTPVGGLRSEPKVPTLSTEGALRKSLEEIYIIYLYNIYILV